MFNPDNLSYSYDKKGYKLFYKGVCIGGAGISKEAKGCISDIKLFKELAEREVNRIKHGVNCDIYLHRIQAIESV